MSAKIKLFLIVCFSFMVSGLRCQEPVKSWHLSDPEKSEFAGIGLEKALSLLKETRRKPKKVIVAVLDSGVDIDHEALSEKIWLNKKEARGKTGRDDDRNGYTDDRNGWNFLGNPQGESIVAETLEVTRLYKKYLEKFGDKDKFSIKPQEKEAYLEFLSLKKEYEAGLNKLQDNLYTISEEMAFLQQLVPPLQKALKKTYFTAEDLNSFEPVNEELNQLKMAFLSILQQNEEMTSRNIIDYFIDLEDKKETFTLRLAHNYSLEFDGRKLIGDNYAILDEKNYGNPDVSRRAEHGTHVAGIIGAAARNDVKGICENAVIMPIRAVPSGDETDKDVANGIRYAIDNGARIINMSFGKAYSPEKQVVDEAVKYAESKGVLLVHGAGNENTNIDLYYSYPTPLLEDGSITSNWIEVGASSARPNESLPADFSNYGKKAVDIFAPGVDIYSTLPESDYGFNSGTSMASPVVAGVAALLLSYFPKLSPAQIKSIIMETGTKYYHKVMVPGLDEEIGFNKLSVSGKVINAHQAGKTGNRKIWQITLWLEKWCLTELSLIV